MALSARSSWGLAFAGWVLFTVSAVFFTIGAAQDGSLIGLAASLSFLVACVLFMIPAFMNRPRSG